MISSSGAAEAAGAAEVPERLTTTTRPLAAGLATVSSEVRAGGEARAGEEARGGVTTRRTGEELRGGVTGRFTTVRTVDCSAGWLAVPERLTTTLLTAGFAATLSSATRGGLTRGGVTWRGGVTAAGGEVGRGKTRPVSA